MMLATQLVVMFGLFATALLADYGEKDHFAYDRQLLDKMIRLEIKMEQMEKERKRMEETVNMFIQNHTRMMENKTAELELLEERADFPLVAFSAYNPIDRSPDTHQIIIWQNTRLNEGNGYDTVIGIFKAPVSGLYYFTVHVCNYSGRVMQYAIVLEQEVIAMTYKYDNENNDCGSMSAITRLQQGQRVWVQCTSGSTNNLIWESSGMSSFLGTLIHK